MVNLCTVLNQHTVRAVPSPANRNLQIRRSPSRSSKVPRVVVDLKRNFLRRDGLAIVGITSDVLVVVLLSFCSSSPSTPVFVDDDHRTFTSPRSCFALAIAALCLGVLVLFQHQAEPFPRVFDWNSGEMGLTRVSVLNADVKSLQKFLQSGSVKSTALVDAYLAQIDRHDGYLHAMLSMPTRESIKNIAIALDEERAAGKVRSPLHGIPVIIKVGKIHIAVEFH